MKPLLSAAALLLSSTAAMADLAPQDILDSWRGFYAGFGATIRTDTPEVTGSTTRFSNVIAQMNMAETDTSYTFDWIEMQSTADGALLITFSPNANAVTLADVSGDVLEGRVSYDLSALSIQASGTPEDIRYIYAAPVITGHQTQSMPEVDVSTTVAVQNLQGETRTTLEAGQISDSANHSIGSLSIKISIKAEDEPSYLDYSAVDITTVYSLSLDQTAIPEAPQPISFYPENFAMGITFETGPARTVFTQNTVRGQSVFSLAQTSSDLTATYNNSSLSYGITSGETTLALANEPAQPVDFTAGFGRAHFGVTLPLRQSQSPSPFALNLALERFTLGPEIWARFDPESTLSQTPASFAFSLNGTAKLFADLFDRSAFTALRGAPFELRSLSLSGLHLDFEGMGLSGDGGVTFNNERIDPMSGMPEPAGVLDFSVNGALGLLDKIGRLGLVEPMVIIGAKGAMGMFATPNSGPDSFTSRIEFTEGGHISVNGQQVK